MNSDARIENNRWYLYIAESKSGKYYVGISNDVERRIESHNRGTGSQLAKFDGPFVLKFCSEALENRSEASKIEYHVKRWPRAKKEKLVQGFIAL
tara:strand:+ start:178 stop:462 length:285 start_codon:yes stop_codon:yes gene_type:complete